MGWVPVAPIAAAVDRWRKSIPLPRSRVCAAGLAAVGRQTDRSHDGAGLADVRWIAFPLEALAG